MAQLDTVDIAVLVTLLVASVAYFTKGTYWAKPRDPYAALYNPANGAAKSQQSRDLLEKMQTSGKNCVVFYGSQTGTAEDYASRLAKEGAQRFGLKTMVADLEDYDYENLDQFPSDHLAVFVLATYGEGEPTDNAVDFYEFIRGDDINFSNGASIDDKPLSNLKYIAFGLGNNTYEHYNAIVRQVDQALSKLGGQRIAKAGEGDDGAGTMEEDFLAWKEPMWAEVREKYNLEEREAVYEPVFNVNVRSDLTADSPEVFVGEPNRNHLEQPAKGPFNASNPFDAPIVASRELFTTPTRHCLHMEVDLTGSKLNYQTGDHLAVWPTNAGREVDRFLGVLGLLDRRHTVVSVSGRDPTARVPFPTPTTYDAIARYYLEIGGAVSRQFVDTLAAFAPNDSARQALKKLGGDKDYFHTHVAQPCLNLAQVLEMAAPNSSITANSHSDGSTTANSDSNDSTTVKSHNNGSISWTDIPFSALIEGLNKIQPRYYSISSSSLVQPQRISLTAVVEEKHLPPPPSSSTDLNGASAAVVAKLNGHVNPGSSKDNASSSGNGHALKPAAATTSDAPARILSGVTTNYLLALHQLRSGDSSPDPYGLRYALSGPRDRYLTTNSSNMQSQNQNSNQGQRPSQNQNQDSAHAVVPVHVRHSNFKLPSDPRRPVIMIGPGTGVAPFRGFVQERAHLKRQGQDVGPTLLFYGCRRASEDFLYRDEWREYGETLGESFELITAFSRDPAPPSTILDSKPASKTSKTKTSDQAVGTAKVYVQHRLREHGAHVHTLLSEQKANFYVCGDAAHMARDVNDTLVSIIAEQRSVAPSAAEAVVKSWRARGVYQEDVWS